MLPELPQLTSQSNSTGFTQNIYKGKLRQIYRIQMSVEETNYYITASISKIRLINWNVQTLDLEKFS